MTLWFVFALMTAAASFAVLWPLSRRGRRLAAAAKLPSIGINSPKSIATLAAGLIGLGRSGCRARRNQPPSAGGGGRRRATACGVVESQMAPFGGGRCAGWIADAGGCDLSSARLAAARRFSACPARPYAGCARSPLDSLVAQVRRTLKRIQPTAAAGACWRRCWRGSAATTRRSAPIAIRSLITATAPSSGPISAKPWPAPPEASSPRRPRPNSSARSR